MTTALKEVPADAQVVAIADVLSPSRYYTFEQVLQHVEGITLNDLQQQFAGAHVTGYEFIEWQKRAVSKRATVRPEFAQRILRIRSATGVSQPFDSKTVPPTNPVPQVMEESAKDESVTLQTTIREGKWYSYDELLEIVDGIDRQTLDREFLHRPHIIGNDFLRFAAIHARHTGNPLTIKASYVDKIMGQRKCHRDRKEETERQVRTEARLLLEQHASMLALYATNDGRVEEIEKKMKKLVYRHPTLFDRSEWPPRLLEPVEV